MAEWEIFPDSEALAAQIIRDAGYFAERVYSSIPKNPTYPICVLKRIGGQPAERHRLDAAEIQVDVWGNNKSAARDGAEAARVALHEAEGLSFYTDLGDIEDAFITGVDDVVGLTFLPDPTSEKDRYLFQVRIYVHGRSPVASGS